MRLTSVGLVVLLVCGARAEAAQISTYAFSTLLQNANNTSRGWYFNDGGQADTATITAAGSGIPVDVTLDEVALGSGAVNGLTHSGGGFASTPSFLWDGAPDQAARDSMSQGGWFGTDMAIHVPVTPGMLYEVEIVGLGAFVSERGFNIVADGVSAESNVTVILDPNFNTLARFTVLADGDGFMNFTFNGDNITSPDNNPFISILTITQVPEPSSLALLLCGVVGLRFFRRTQR